MKKLSLLLLSLLSTSVSAAITYDINFIDMLDDGQHLVLIADNDGSNTGMIDCSPNLDSGELCGGNMNPLNSVHTQFSYNGDQAPKANKSIIVSVSPINNRRYLTLIKFADLKDGKLNNCVILPNKLSGIEISCSS